MKEVFFGILGLMVLYVICRMAAYAIAKSWFQVKLYYELRKEDEDGERQEETKGR